MRHHLIVGMVACLALLGSISASHASEPPASTGSDGAAPGQAPDFFGQGWNDLWLTPEEFQGTADPKLIHNGQGWWVSNSIGTEEYRAHLVLPNGALIDRIDVVYRDVSVTGRIEILFDRLDFDFASPSIGASTTLAFFSPLVDETPGYAVASIDLDPDVVYLNRATGDTDRSFYIIRAFLPADFDVRFRGVIVSWRRQVSPAPASATFDDVPLGAFGFQHVEALAASGITAGCDASNFCPNQPLTRVQMAVFLAKALGLYYAP